VASTRAKVEKPMNLKTYSAKLADLEPRWYVVDAQDKVLGRLATEIATILKGKHKPAYTPHLNCGDFVIVVNAAKVAVTRDRLDEKIYYRHSQYPGGLKQETLRQAMQRHPERVIERAVKGMLPHNRLGADMLHRMKVYAGPEHPHQAQQPVPWEPLTAERVLAEQTARTKTTAKTTTDATAATATETTATKTKTETAEA
jgi:large subunit ribosomal protein L13